MSGAPILVTGGAGFVGRALSTWLVSQGRRVVCLDVVEPSWARADASIEVIRGDVCDARCVEEQVARCELVIHLAALVGVDAYVSAPARVLDVDVLGSRNVLSACLARRRPVVMAGTSEIGGGGADLLAEESEHGLASASRAQRARAASRMAAEQYAHALGAAGLSFAIVRFFDVYGPLSQGPGVGDIIGKFVGALLRREPLPRVDAGRALRSPCYVDDAAEATGRLALALAAGRGVGGRAYDVGRDEPVTIAELAERMERLFGRGVGEVDVHGATGCGPGFEEIPRRVPDLSRLHDAIGFRASIDLNSGLTRTLAHWDLRSSEPERAPRTPPPPPLVPWIRPVFEPDRALLETYRAALESGCVTNDGPLTRRFEHEAARWLGVPEAVAVSSGADALLLLLRALGRTGKAILPSFTYIATLAALVHNGLEPVFCDIEPGRWTLDPGALALLLAEHRDVSVVVPVNVFGVPPRLDVIAAMVRETGASLLYDNAHGFGTEVDAVRVPPEPAAQIFSLHATKMLPAIEGGLVVGAPDLLAEVRRARAHGLAADPLRSEPGFNSKLDELRAATASHSLARLDASIERRRTYALRVRSSLERCEGFWQVQEVPANVRSNFQNLGVRSAHAHVGIDAIVAAFRREGVEVRRYFHPPLHRLERFSGATLPQTDALSASLVCLPIHSRMSEHDLARVERAAAQVARELSRRAP